MQQTGVKKEAKQKYDQKEGIEKFQKRSGTSGIDGHFFEINLLTLLKLRGESKSDRFYLAGNMAEIGAFDDIVFRYWYNKDGQKTSKIIFLQAKHTDDVQKGKITIEKLTKKGDNFDLNKYLVDYLRIKQKFDIKSSDPVFKGNFEDLDCDFVVYTNAVLDEKFDSNRLVNVDKSSNSILLTKQDGKAFKFKMDKGINADVINILFKNTKEEHVTSLAKKFIKYVYSKSDYESMMRDELFKVYHVFLVQKVINVSKETKVQRNRNKYGKLKESKFREGKFRDDFLEGSNQDPYLEIFRKTVYECTKEEVFKRNTNYQLQYEKDQEIENLAKQIADLLESSEGKKINKEDITKNESIIETISKLAGSVLVLEEKSRNFKFAQRKLLKGNANKIMDVLEKRIIERHLNKNVLEDYTFNIPDEVIKLKLQMQTIQLPIEFGNFSPKLQDIKYLANKVSNFFDECLSKKIVTIDKDVKGMNKLVGNLLVLNEETGMLKLTDKELTGDVKNFMDKLRNVVEAKGINDDELRKYNFDIKIKSFPRLSLVGKLDEVENEVHGFLHQLKFFTGQSIVEELENVIQKELMDFYKLTIAEVKPIFLEIQDKMKIWWGQKGQSCYLTKNDGFWGDVLKTNIRFNVKGPVHFFIGRVKELNDLHSKIMRRSEKLTVISQIMSISGLGGVGKTELARQYIHMHSEDYDNNVIWIDAESEENLIESFHKLAQNKLGISTKNIDGKKKDIKCIVDEVYEFFSKRRSLFIFDNAEGYKTTNEEIGIDVFLPHLPTEANKPYILITSRKQNWGDIKVLLLNVFNEGDSVEFIRKSLNIEDGSQENDIKKLVEILHRFPLALQQAVAYIKQADKDIKYINPKKEFIINDYLKEYEDKAKELLDFPFPDDSSDFYTKTTFTTWKITTDKIKANKKLGVQAAEILNIIAYFSPQNIRTNMFLKLANASERELGSTVGLLKQYSMVGLEQGVLNIHRLVQQVTRIQLKDEKREEKFLEKAFKLIKANFPYDADSLEDCARKQQLLPHAEALLSSIDNWLENDLAEKHKIETNYLEDLLLTLADGYFTLGDHNKQKKFLERALPIFQSHYGPEHFAVARVSVGLSVAYWALGDPYKQKELLVQALPVFQSHYGPDHFEVAKILAYLGNAYGALGDPHQKKELIELALPILKSYFGDEHSEVAVQLTNLGNAYGALGDPNKKKELLEEALSIGEIFYDHDHFEVAKILANLGNAYRELGNPHKAKELLEQALAIQERFYGHGHFEVAKTLSNLGNAYGALGDPTKQNKLLKRALPIMKEHFDYDHPYIVNIVRSLDIFSSREEIEGALELKPKLGQLFLAVKEGDLHRIRSLIENDWDINIYDDIGHRTPLHFSSESGHLNIISMLLQNGANIEALDINDSTPLHYAAHNNHKEVLKALLENGANVNAVDSHNKKPIDYTTSDLIKSFLRSTNELFTAISENSVQMVENLIQKGGVVNAVDDSNKFTLLHYAAHSGNINIVHFLLSKGVNVNARDKDDWTPIHYAAQRGQRDVVEALLNEGANIDVRNNKNQLPLEIVWKYGNLDILDLFTSSQYYNFST